METSCNSKNKEDFKSYPKYFEEKIQNLQKLFDNFYTSNTNNIYTNIIGTINEEIENNYKIKKEKDLSERKHKKEDKIMKFNSNINSYKDDFEKLISLKDGDRTNFEEINKIANNIKEIPFETEEKKKIFLDNKESEIKIQVFKLDNPGDIEQLEIEKKIIRLIDYKKEFYAFSENHLYVYYKDKSSPKKLSSIISVNTNIEK